MDDVHWVTAYLHQHSLSSTSTQQYTYLFWASVTLILIVLSLLRYGTGASSFGAYCRRWTIRKRTIRTFLTGPHPFSLPSNGQLLALFMLTCATFVLAFVGPDAGLSPSTSAVDAVTGGKTYWTLAARNGDIAFALFPLCVLFVLKSSPFAIFSLSFTTQLHFDKLAWLHRWTGKLIWATAALHVGLWSVQLVKDKHTTTGDIAYKYAWKYENFIYGWVAFGLLTLLMLSSLTFIRRSFYQTFHYLHMLLVPGTLVMSALHHPPIGYWCWAAIALWVGERCYRGTWWIYMNGVLRGPPPSERSQQLLPVSAHRTLRSGPPSPYLSPQPESFYTGSQILATSSAFTYSPPPGYAYAQMLSGHTIRLTYTCSEKISWAPGQHFLVRIPAISKFATHPFTCASLCDDKAPATEKTVLVFLIGVKGGWTKDLWSKVTELLTSGMSHVPGETPPRNAALPQGFGVLLKMTVDGPFGGSVDTNWGAHSTLLIVAGGSGITFGLPVLEFACMILAGRNGKHLGGKSGGFGHKGFAIRRIRLVWLVREFSHLQWCATILRRCISMIPDGLQVNVFVTNHALVRNPTGRSPISPAPRTALNDLEDDDDDDDGLVDLSAYTTEFGDEEARPGSHYDYTRELTNFDGDDDHDILPLSGEAMLNHTVRMVGRQSRTISKSFSFTGMRDSVAPRPSRMQHAVTMSRDGSLITQGPNEFVTKSSLDSTASEAVSGREASWVTSKSISFTGVSKEPVVHRPSGMQNHVVTMSQDGVLTNQGPDESTSDSRHASLDSTPPVIVHRRDPSWISAKGFSFKEPTVHKPSALHHHITASHDGVIADDQGPEDPTSASRRSSLESTSSDIARQPRLSISDPPSHFSRVIARESDFARPRLPTLTVPTQYPPSMYSYNTPNSSTHDWAMASADAFDLDTGRSSVVSPLASADGALKLRIPEEEMEDINSVAEYARPGKPKLAAILSHEVERSTGSVVVACCGPVSLNALVRKMIAAQINPSRIRRGDQRGKIDLVSEEFSF